MIRWIIPILFSYAALMNIPCAASADEIILLNGDKLTGTVTKIEEGTLTLKTEYSEPIKIQKEKIKSVFTDKAVQVTLESGETLKGVLITSSDGRLIVESSEVRQASVIDWTKVKSVYPPSHVPKKWKGRVTVGANAETGNTRRTSASIISEATRRTDSDRFSLRFLYNYAEDEGEVTARNAYGAFKYDYFFTKSFYGYLGVELLNDKFKDLKLRTVVGPGAGYQFWDEPDKSLLLEAGLSYFSEDLDEGEDDQWITARFAGDMRYKVWDRIVFTDRLVLYPSIKNIGQYQLRNEAGLESPLAFGWSLSLTNIIERDSDPPEDVKKNDIYWILGMQYSF